MRTIYFPRYQRAFGQLGEGVSVGSHPYLRFVAHPPEGYRFDSTPLTWSQWLTQLPIQCWRLSRRWRQLRTLGNASGLGGLDVFRFVRSRGLSRLVPARKGTAATFLPTYPLTHLNENWFIEIEDTTTALDPYALNGRTAGVRFRELKAFPLIRQLFESPRCLGVLTHVRSTRDGMKTLFQSDTITSKVQFLPLAYVPPIPVSESDLDKERAPHRLRFFFNNSWHQSSNNFFLRGGISILECFEQLLARNYPISLVLRSALPEKIRNRFASLLAHPNVEVRDRFMTADEYVGLLRSSHYFLLPSARIHVVSIMEAMYYGAVPIVSDGWGIREYVEDNVTGHVVSGIYGRVSWVDPETGALQEDYAPMYGTPGIMTEALGRCLTGLLDNPSDRTVFALRAHRRVRDRHNIDLFNLEFSRFLERGFAGLESISGPRDGLVTLDQ